MSLKQFSVISQETDPSGKIAIFYLEGPSGHVGSSWMPLSAPLRPGKNQNHIASDILEEIGVVPVGFLLGPKGYSFIVLDEDHSIWDRFSDATERRWNPTESH